jgi:hypothetical protein
MPEGQAEMWGVGRLGLGPDRGAENGSLQLYVIRTFVRM